MGFDRKMALNPQLFPNGMPVPFVNEMFVLARDGVEFEVDKIPGSGSVFFFFFSFLSLTFVFGLLLVWFHVSPILRLFPKLYQFCNDEIFSH